MARKIAGARRELDKVKDIQHLSILCKAPPEDIWGIITGDVAKRFDVAVRLGFLSGLKPETLMYKKSKKLRKGFLVWLSTRTKIPYVKLGHIMKGRRKPTWEEAESLELVTGIQARDWRRRAMWMNRK